MNAEQYKISLFLHLFKEFASCSFQFVPRKKNLDSLAQLGITIQQAKGIIMGLTYRNYYRGPLRDRMLPEEEIWEFGTDLGDMELYIKIKVNTPQKMGICLSFHRAEKDMTYPYK